MSTPDEPRLEVVELAGGPERREPPLPVFCMITFILMVPIFLFFWAAAVGGVMYLARPELDELRPSLPQMVYLKMYAAWALVLLGIPASLTLLLTPGRIGLALGWLTVLALAVTVALSVGDAIFTPRPVWGPSQRFVFIFWLIVGTVFRTGLGIWYGVALRKAYCHKFPRSNVPSRRPTGDEPACFRPRGGTPIVRKTARAVKAGSCARSRSKSRSR